MKHFLFLIVAFLLFQCKSQSEQTSPAVDLYEEYSGGQEGTVFDAGVNAFGNSLINLNSDEVTRFVIGNSFNRNNWVTAPSSTSARDGLGPLFNATSCSSCHLLDGRGKPTDDNGAINQALLFRLSVPGVGPHGGPMPHPIYGDQFSPRAIAGVLAEGDVTVTYTNITGSYPDGTPYSLQKPTYSFKNLNYGDISDAMVSPRIAPVMAGVGLLEAVSDADILSRVDENDTNADGISGKANYVWDAQLQRKVLGKFGWKANQPTVAQQVGGAFSGDMGITSSMFPTENISPNQLGRLGALPNGGEPEIEDAIFDDVVFYIKTLAVPARRDWKNETIVEGKKLFMTAQCNGCHVASLTTGSSSDMTLLNKQAIKPYTDLLLHDMGDGLADGRPDFDATGSEWRTAPLWGIGLVQAVNKHTQFLHDGRARNIEEAILWHGGEAEKSKTAFMNLNKTQRASVIAFINSL
ncbi:di-heme oxidoreductase family protein [Dyadobacter jejuensis]|uniref:di-heme oxidoreductase family protein n=1 Tax=Dyadobacter jejuensis TaxID=1082580 RepID=UPI001E50E917|nr:di-heme oxidoredictase family protein [Dyadobacter jejuensis]